MAVYGDIAHYTSAILHDVSLAMYQAFRFSYIMMYELFLKKIDEMFTQVF